MTIVLTFRRLIILRAITVFPLPGSTSNNPPPLLPTKLIYLFTIFSWYLYNSPLKWTLIGIPFGIKLVLGVLYFLT